MEPQVRLGVAHLSKLAYSGHDLRPVQLQRLDDLLKGHDASAALMDLSVIAQIHGDPAMGLDWQTKALATHRAFSTNRTHPDQPKLLVFAEACNIGGNTPVEFLLQDADFEVITFYPNADTTPADLPDHDVAFCAARAETDTAEAFFAQVRTLTTNTGKPVLNLPDALVQPERDALQTLFATTPGLRTAKTARFTRAELLASLDGQDTVTATVVPYPNIIRPLGSHAGIGLAKLATRDDLVTYLAQRDEDDFFVSEFINYASPADGLFRKQRVVFIDGRAYPSHMAIAARWDVWYMNAEMDKSADKRAEEAAFMHSFDTGFAQRNDTALTALAKAFDFDYFGIDCAEDSHGNLVIFEADNALIVHHMDSETMFPYKTRHMTRLFKAFETMLKTANR
ncbi:MAG: ATP-grasp domain-containing protein [Shimia sp.]|uniref:ATP-grasp domain-containing protein n=1 Tax=Shimia sp. TaxID=1954381 RepID=UPI0040593C28